VNVSTDAGTWPIRLSDHDLVSWFKKDFQNIDFIKNRIRDEFHSADDELHQAIENLRDKPLYQQTEVVATLWRHLLGRAIVFLKSKDDRENYHDAEDYGVEILNKFLGVFRDFEPLLYGAQVTRYRDHMAHTICVFLAGACLISRTIQFSSIDTGDAILPESSRISDAEKIAMWCVMSLTHDLGIALEKIPEINQKARSMLESFRMANTRGISYQPTYSLSDELAIRIASSDLHKVSRNPNHMSPTTCEAEYHTHVQAKYYSKLAQAYERQDHGVMGATVIAKNLTFFLETDYSFDQHRPLNCNDAKQFLIRRNILRAIATHSNDNIYYLKVTEFPFLLFIIDEMQEWGRPRLSEWRETEVLERDVTVPSMTNEEVHYCVAIRPPEKAAETLSNKAELEALRIFISKCDKYRRVLRSAVAPDRALTVTLEVKGINGRPALRLIHKNPQEVQLMRDGQRTSFSDLQAQERKLRSQGS